MFHCKVCNHCETLTGSKHYENESKACFLLLVANAVVVKHMPKWARKSTSYRRRSKWRQMMKRIEFPFKVHSHMDKGEDTHVFSDKEEWTMVSIQTDELL